MALAVPVADVKAGLHGMTLLQITHQLTQEATEDELQGGFELRAGARPRQWQGLLIGLVWMPESCRTDILCRHHISGDYRGGLAWRLRAGRWRLQLRERLPRRNVGRRWWRRRRRWWPALTRTDSTCRLCLGSNCGKGYNRQGSAIFKALPSPPDTKLSSSGRQKDGLNSMQATLVTFCCISCGGRGIGLSWSDKCATPVIWDS